MMTCIDVLSKYAWVSPMLNKTGIIVAKELEIICKQGRVPDKIQSDEGTEFLNKNVKTLLNTYNVELYILNSEMKASVVERFNRTIKEKMYRYFTAKRTHKYIDIIQDLVQSYNNSFHRSIKRTPTEVNSENEDDVRETLYFDASDEFLNFKFNKGDYVRISKNKHIFEKKYTPNWSQEIFKIIEVLPRSPPVYRIEDLNNEKLEGIFYETELQKVQYLNEQEKFWVDEILKTKKNKKGEKTHYFVSWQGYPSNFNSWIKISDYDI